MQLKLGQILLYKNSWMLGSVLQKGKICFNKQHHIYIRNSLITTMHIDISFRKKNIANFAPLI